MTRVVLETKANTNFSVSLEPNPYRLVVEVRKIGAAPKAAVNLFPNADKNKLAMVVPLRRRRSSRIDAGTPEMHMDWSDTPGMADGISVRSDDAGCWKKMWSSKSRSDWASCFKLVWGRT